MGAGASGMADESFFASILPGQCRSSLVYDVRCVEPVMRVLVHAWCFLYYCRFDFHHALFLFDHFDGFFYHLARRWSLMVRINNIPDDYNWEVIKLIII